MRDAPERTPRESEGRVERQLDRARQGSRALAAGREFLDALRSDLALILARLRRALIRLWQRLWQHVSRRSGSLRSAASARAAPLPAPSAAARAASFNSRPIGAAAWARASGRVLRHVAIGIAVAAVGGTLVFSAAMLWALHGLPLDHPAEQPDGPTLLLEAADGAPLGRFGPLKLPDASLSDYPAVLIKAVLSTEDRRFYSHFGIDPLGIVRAVHRNMRAGEIVEGGSTITQQLVKMRYLGADRTYAHKLREALTAIWLEAHLSKDEILTRYLNRVYLGAGAYGMPAAAQLYFAKRPAKLTLAEAAMLAGLIKAPSELNPLRHLEAAQQRAAAVLDGMVANGVIDQAAAKAAKASPARPRTSPQVAPAGSWFTDWVGRQGSDVVGPNAGSVRVRTTLRPDLQRLAQDTLNAALAREGRSLGVSQGAVVARRPDGSVVAMVGGRDYGASQFNRAIEANRQPGSAFKLFVYLAALRMGYSPSDTIDASPVDIGGWEPQNYGGKRYGRIRLAEAFAQSVNTAAVRLAMNVGLDQVIAAARDLGVHAQLAPMPSLALGAVGVSPLELTSAFASVRANRVGVQPWGIAAVEPTRGTPMRKVGAPVSSGRTLDPYDKPLIDLLRGVIEHGTGRAAALDGFAAGKTGTSQNYRDAWFIGFNDALIVGVWLGNDDNSPMRHVVGGSLPAAIWKSFMVKATPLIENQPTPVAEQANATETNGAGAQSRAFPFKSGDQTAQGAPDEASPPQCDIQACSSAYRSFRSSDCTYRSYSGSRRVCEIGGQPSRRVETEDRGDTGDHARSADARAQASCNVAACARHYSSFDPYTCTYQPLDGGPRQFCTR